MCGGRPDKCVNKENTPNSKRSDDELIKEIWKKFHDPSSQNNGKAFTLEVGDRRETHSGNDKWEKMFN